MSEQQAGKRIPGDDQTAAELRSAVHAGDVEAIQRLLRNDPALATARFIGRGGAAALGMLGRLEEILASDPPAEEVSQAFWHACTGGQRRAAEYLPSCGADLNWEPDYAHGTPLDAASVLNTRQENVISWLRELEARSSGSDGQEPS